jgi:hypothetical protein
MSSYGRSAELPQATFTINRTDLSELPMKTARGETVNNKASAPLHKISYSNKDKQYVAEVGLQRTEAIRKTGPRGGYIPDAPYGWPTEVGSVVTSIEYDEVRKCYSVFSELPSGLFTSPTYVGRVSVKQVWRFPEP